MPTRPPAVPANSGARRLKRLKRQAEPAVTEELVLKLQIRGPLRVVREPQRLR